MPRRPCSVRVIQTQKSCSSENSREIRKIYKENRSSVRQDACWTHLSLQPESIARNSTSPTSSNTSRGRLGENAGLTKNQMRPKSPRAAHGSKRKSLQSSRPLSSASGQPPLSLFWDDRFASRKSAASFSNHPWLLT